MTSELEGSFQASAGNVFSIVFSMSSPCLLQMSSDFDLSTQPPLEFYLWRAPHYIIKWPFASFMRMFIMQELWWSWVPWRWPNKQVWTTHESSHQVSTMACEWPDYFTHFLAWEKAWVPSSKGISACSLESWKYAWLDLWKWSHSFCLLWESKSNKYQACYHLQWN